MGFVPRYGLARLRQLMRTFAAVLVLGPRQCGKSTLVRRAFPDWRLIDLERPSDHSLVQADLEGFLAANPRRVIFDEAQRLPELFAALRYALDSAPRRGRYLLLGSASPHLVGAVSETLAGRVGLFELTPLLSRELAPTAGRDRWFWGGLPPVHARRGPTARGDWLDALISTVLERDLPLLGLRLPAQRLRALLGMLTHVHGNLLNVADLARSLAVSSPTVAANLDVLEATYLIRRLPPFFANVQKRLTKSPKLYLRDTGLLHLLAGLRRPAELETWSRRGASFEGLVIEELAALAHLQLGNPQLFFWRTQAGAEVDLLIVHGRRILPIEINLGASIDRRSVAGLRQCMADLSLRRGWVVCTGPTPSRLGRDIEIIPWHQLARGEIDLAALSRRAG